MSFKKTKRGQIDPNRIFRAQCLLKVILKKRLTGFKTPAFVQALMEDAEFTKGQFSSLNIDKMMIKDSIL